MYIILVSSIEIFTSWCTIFPLSTYGLWQTRRSKVNLETPDSAWDVNDFMDRNGEFEVLIFRVVPIPDVSEAAVTERSSGRMIDLQSVQAAQLAGHATKVLYRGKQMPRENPRLTFQLVQSRRGFVVEKSPPHKIHLTSA